MFTSLNSRQNDILSHVLLQRVSSFSELKSIFFKSVSRQAAMKSLASLCLKCPSLLEIRSRGVGAKKFIVAKPIPGVATTFHNHDIMVSEIRKLFLGAWESIEWVSELELRLNIKKVLSADIPYSFPYHPDGLVIHREGLGMSGVKTLGIELELSLKNRRRIRERLLSIEDALKTHCDRFLIIATSDLVLNSYKAELSEILKRQRKEPSQARARLLHLDIQKYKSIDFKKTIEEVII